MKKANSAQLQITSSVLKMVRKISGASFNNKLEDYSLNFSSTSSIGILSFNLSKGEEFCEVFPSYPGAKLSKCAFFNTPIPSTVSDIERFEGDVELGLAQIFKHAKGVK